MREPLGNGRHVRIRALTGPHFVQPPSTGSPTTHLPLRADKQKTGGNSEHRVCLPAYFPAGGSQTTSCPSACYLIFSYCMIERDRKSTRLNSSHITISYAVFCLKKIFFNDTATTEIYTLSLHDAFPISIFQQVALKPPPVHLPAILFFPTV